MVEAAFRKLIEKFNTVNILNELSVILPTGDETLKCHCCRDAIIERSTPTYCDEVINTVHFISCGQLI